MRVYEFWLKDQFKTQGFEVLCESFYSIGQHFIRKVDEGTELDGLAGSAVYSVSRNPETHWVQLLVDDNTSQPIITAIEGIINGLKDEEPYREYTSEKDHHAPMEQPK